MMTSEKLTTRRALVAAVRVSGDAIRGAARDNRCWLALCAILVLLQAGIPGAQVVLLESLLEALSNTATDPVSFWASLLMLAVVVGSMHPLVQVSVAANQRLALRRRLRYRARLARAAANLKPSQLARPDIMTLLEASNAATGAMDAVAGKTLQLAGAVTTSALLCAVWSINPASGLLVAAALLPTMLAFTAVARTEARGWPVVAEFERRAGYATEQLVRQRPGTELAVLGSGHKVADLVIARRRDASAVLDRMISTAMQMELAAAVATALLSGASLVVMVLSDVGGGGGAAAAVAGILSGLNAVRHCGYAFGTIVAAAPQARIYHEFMRNVTDVEARAIAGTAESIRVMGACATYPGSDSFALHNVSMHAVRGEMIALVGVNGAGKTTLVNAIIGSLELSSGTVTIDEGDAGNMTEAERLGYFGVLVQEFGKFELTVRDVVALGTPDQYVDDGRVEEALASASAARFVAQLPDGIETQLGQQWNGVGMSGGQWQRLALVRIYLRNAAIWILDEPTSSIDAEAELEIFKELRRTKGSRITIVVSHRAWTLKDMDRIYVIDDGRIVQDGTYEQLMTQRCGRFAQIFAEQEITLR